MISFVLLTVFAVKKPAVSGFPIILAGIAMNFLVIGLNSGMPVARHALVASDQMATLHDLIDNAVEAPPRDVGRRPRCSSPM